MLLVGLPLLLRSGAKGSQSLLPDLFTSVKDETLIIFMLQLLSFLHIDVN